MQQEQQRNFFGGGMDSDSAIEYIDKVDYLSAWNIRNTGTDKQEMGYITSIEGTVQVPFALPAGINKCIGSKSFPNRRIVVSAIYNSNLKHTITEYNYDTNIITKVFQNITDSGGLDILNLNPDKYVEDWDYIGDELYFLPSSRIPSKINVERFKSGYYGVIKAEDISVIQAKPEKLVTYSYINDAGRSTNLVENKILKIASQYQYNNGQESVFSELSKTFLPTVGQAIATPSGVNNGILVKVFVGGDRVEDIVVAARFENEEVWKEIKKVNRKEAIAITATTVNLLADVREAFLDGYYYFVFSNDGLYIPIDTLTTDLEYDRVPKTAEAQVGLNGSLIAYGNITEGFNPPKIDITTTVSYVDKIPATLPTATDPLKEGDYGYVREGSILRRPIIYVFFSGVAKTGDSIYIETQHKNTGVIQSYPYTVPVDFNNNTLGAIDNFGATQTSLGYNVRDDGSRIEIQFEISQYHRILTVRATAASVTLNTDFKSTSTLKLNSSRQYGIMYEYPYGRLGGVLTNDNLIVKTAPYSVSGGFAPSIKIDIKNKPAKGAIGYHIVSSGQTTHQDTVYMVGTRINPIPYVANSYFKNAFVSFENAVYRSIVDNNNAVTTDDTKWNKVGSLGDYLNNTYIAFDVTSLKKFNDKNASSVINYEYTKGDRANLSSYFDGFLQKDVFFNTNPKDVAVSGFEIDLVDNSGDETTTGFILKINKSDIDTTAISFYEVLIEVYTPKKSVDETKLYFTIGERYDIIAGEHSVKEITIDSGEAFLKTREYQGTINPLASRSYVVEDFNYSDFADTRVNSLGRGYLYDNKFKEINNKAWIRYSDVFNQANNLNLLNRFKTENVYGVANGQTTDLYGGIMKMRQRGSSLLTLQELETGYIPVNTTIYEDVTGQSNVAVSDKLLNNIRYNGNGYGIGKSTKSFAENEGDYYWVDPNKSEPIKADQGAIRSIAGKMSKFFRDTLQAVTISKRSIIGFYNAFYDEYTLSIESESGVVTQIPFDAGNWVGDTYAIPNMSDISIVQPTNGNVVQSSGYLHNYTGNVAGYYPFQIIVVDGVTRNICVTVTAAQLTPNQFTFIDSTGRPLSTVVVSNGILVTGIIGLSPISIVGGEYEINGSGVWLTTAGTVSEFDSIKVRGTSSASFTTGVDVTLTIGGVSDTFTITTIGFKWIGDEATAVCQQANLVDYTPKWIGDESTATCEQD